MRHVDYPSRTYPGTRLMAGLALGLAFYLFCRSTIPPGGATFMDSPLYPWGWLALPAAAFVLARATTGWGAAWGLTLVLPQAVFVVTGGHFDGVPAVQLESRSLQLVIVLALLAAGAGFLGLVSARPPR